MTLQIGHMARDRQFEHQRRRGLGARGTVLGLAMGIIGAFVVPVSAMAQDFPQAWIDGAAVWRVGGCGDCHGKYANGEPAVEEAPVGPNLRETSLTQEQIVEVIRCGRPDTPMPYNEAGAYAKTECFGIPAGGEALAGTGKELTPEQIENLATYVAEAVKGAGEISLDDCAIYYGGNRDHGFCRRFR